MRAPAAPWLEIDDDFFIFTLFSKKENKIKNKIVFNEFERV